MPKSPIKQTTVSDFGGGWNVADSDLNMASRFQPVSDNVIRGVNGSITPRWGYQLFADARNGETGTIDLNPVAYSVTEFEAWITITKSAHGLSNGDHITITAATILTSTLGGIPASDCVGTFGVVVIDVDTFKFAVRTAASSTDSGNIDLGDSVVWDNHVLAGDIIHAQYFNRHMILFDTVGEIATMSDEDGTLTRIWDASISHALSGNPVPTRDTELVSSTTFKSTVISCNGADRDKPLQIDENFNVEFLVDKSTNSNADVPCADIVLGMQGYVIFLRTANGGDTQTGDPFVSFSAKNTDGTFSGETSPQDAVDIDLSMITDTVNPVILGAAPFRDKLFAAFYDRGMIGTIGEYNSEDEHVPDFSDTISEHGTIAHRTIVPLGNDIFMADYAGVPSVSISTQSGSFVPVRLSELIGPEIQKHLASLSEATLRTRAFALFNKSDRMYMLFLPIYDEVAQTLFTDPFLFNDELKKLNQAIVIAPNHKLFSNSYVTVAGADTISDLDAGDINGVRRVVHVIDRDSFVIQLGGAPTAQNVTFGGGNSVTITPVDNETICYGFEFNKELKIRRWTRLRGMNFSCGASTQRGRIYFAKGGRVFRYGNAEEPLYADEISNYDYRAWSTSTAYVAGDRVYDSSDGFTYIARIDHTSADSGTFAEYREANFDVWEQYLGEPIEWQFETPWSDLQERGSVKQLKYVSHDTEGSAQFNFSVFSNQVYRDPQTYALSPARELQFSGGGVGGYGMVDPAGWGTGRRTREERAWPMPVRGKLLRLRYSGSTRDYLRIISTTLYYLVGNIR